MGTKDRERDAENMMTAMDANWNGRLIERRSRWGCWVRRPVTTTSCVGGKDGVRKIQNELGVDAFWRQSFAGQEIIANGQTNRRSDVKKTWQTWQTRRKRWNLRAFFAVSFCANWHRRKLEVEEYCDEPVHDRGSVCQEALLERRRCDAV
jgi:hypothetical protein